VETLGRRYVVASVEPAEEALWRKTGWSVAVYSVRSAAIARAHLLAVATREHVVVMAFDLKEGGSYDALVAYVCNGYAEPLTDLDGEITPATMSYMVDAARTRYAITGKPYEPKETDNA
jgi:hypothetical protein